MQKISYGFLCVWLGCMITMMGVIAKDIIEIQDNMDYILHILDKNKLMMEQLNIILDKEI